MEKIYKFNKSHSGNISENYSVKESELSQKEEDLIIGQMFKDYKNNYSERIRNKFFRVLLLCYFNKDINEA